MYEILALAYELLSEFVPFMVVLILTRRHRGRYAQPLSWKAWIYPAVFALYVMAVFYITNPGTIYDVPRVRWESLGERVNLIPFSNEIHVPGYLLNIVMFLPFGFLVPMIWKGMDKLPRTAAASFAFSLLIEVSQLLSYRGTDVDDLIMNTLGGILGFLAYKLCSRVTGDKLQGRELPAVELPVFILAVFLGRFFLFHRMGLIRLLYGE